MERQLVSVILSTYNGVGFLEEQINSILQQTYSPVELVISDDASTDNTVEVLKKYENNSAIRVYYQEKNMGLTAGFVFAAQHSKGKWIAFSDQDDIWHENKIEKLVAGIGNNNLVYSDSLLVDETGKSMNRQLSGLKKMYTGNDSRGYILYSCVWGHGMMITRELFEKSLPVPDGVHHDIWITYCAFLNGGIKYLDEALTQYRRHISSASLTLPEKHTKRLKESRYEAYKKKLRWIELMQQYERPEHQSFYLRLLKLYGEKERRIYVFPLIGFMLKYRKEIFMLSVKGFASNFVEILKQARGVKA